MKSFRSFRKKKYSKEELQSNVDVDTIASPSMASVSTQSSSGTALTKEYQPKENLEDKVADQTNLHEEEEKLLLVHSLSAKNITLDFIAEGDDVKVLVPNLADTAQVEEGDGASSGDVRILTKEFVATDRTSNKGNSGASSVDEKFDKEEFQTTNRESEGISAACSVNEKFPKKECVVTNIDIQSEGNSADSSVDVKIHVASSVDVKIHEEDSVRTDTQKKRNDVVSSGNERILTEKFVTRDIQIEDNYGWIGTKEYSSENSDIVMSAKESITVGTSNEGEAVVASKTNTIGTSGSFKKKLGNRMKSFRSFRKKKNAKDELDSDVDVSGTTSPSVASASTQSSDGTALIKDDRSDAKFEDESIGIQTTNNKEESKPTNLLDVNAEVDPPLNDEKVLVMINETGSDGILSENVQTEDGGDVAVQEGMVKENLTPTESPNEGNSGLTETEDDSSAVGMSAKECISAKIGEECKDPVEYNKNDAETPVLCDFGSWFSSIFFSDDKNFKNAFVDVECE